MANRSRPLSILRHHFARYRRPLAVIPICSFLAGLADALALVLLAQVALSLTDPEAALPEVGGLSLPGDPPLTVLPLVIVLATLVRFGLQTASASAAAGVITDVNVRARQSALDGFLATRWSAQAGARQGDLQHLAGEPVTRMSELTNYLTRLLTHGLNLAALLLSALLVDARAMAAIGFMGVVLFAALRPVVGYGRRMSERERDAIRDFGTEMAEVESMALEIRTFDVGDAVRDRGRQLLDGLRKPLFRRYIVLPMLPYTYQLAVIVTVAVGLRILMSFEGADLAAFGAIALLLIKAMNHGQAVQSSWQQLHIALPFAEQLLEAEQARAAAPTPSGTVRVQTIDRLEADGVGLCYPDGHRALQDVRFTVHRGEAIGVVGPSGAGKSSLLQLLLRLREPTEGRLLVNGTDLSMIALDSWYRVVAFVPQECHLFGGTIAENIGFHRPGFDDTDIRAAASAAGLDAMLSELPDGIETRLGPRGSGLSGGQRQRVAIARALVGRPEILVLDEPTSALDGRAERAITDTLTSLQGEVTTIIVTHRLSTVAHCDRVLELADGRLEASGPGPALVRQG